MPQLTPSQRAAVEHAGGRLTVVGGPGTGKTTVLVERFAWLCGGARRRSSSSAPTPRRSGRASRSASRAASRSCTSRPSPGFCARLLHDEAIEAGLSPFFAPASAADRLALLLDRVDELSVRLHDFRGSPAAMLAGIVARIDRLKARSITAAGLLRLGRDAAR